MIRFRASVFSSLSAQELAVRGLQFQNCHSALDSEAFLSDGKRTVHAILPYLLSQDMKAFLYLDREFDCMVLVADDYRIACLHSSYQIQNQQLYMNRTLAEKNRASMDKQSRSEPLDK